jgi:NADH dehydrogenase
MNLIVSGTGALGMEACRLLAAQRAPTRALVRVNSKPEKLAELKGLGAELMTGDLKDPASLKAACEGVSAIVSAATSVHSHESGDSIDTVDRQGQLALVDAAEAQVSDTSCSSRFPRSTSNSRCRAPSVPSRIGSGEAG